MYIVYENASLPITTSAIIINNQNYIGNENYVINNLNSINTFYPVSFSLYTDRTGGNFAPDENVYFNSNLLGTIGGSDNINSAWNYAGVKGHFYYQNNQLFGLDDDTPDATMNGTDGLADVSSYLTNNATSCNFQLINILYPNQADNNTNSNLAYFLTYTSPCTPFPVSVPSDTTVCYKSPLQLNASGGQRYEWQSPNGTTNNPAPGLSCSDCPNPVFSADSSMFYTVRIWNNDSCSIVRPLKITVLPQPKSATFTTSNTECGISAGSITAAGVGNALSALNAISENGDTLAVSGNKLSNLSAGKYTVFYIDTNGCHSKDSLLTIQSVNNTVANFTVTPSAGGAPLSVTVSNTSQNATHYSWSLNGEPQNDPFNGFLADTSGVYTVQLIAWKNDILCADTTYMNVLVYDSLITTIPNIFTPNDDHINDIFSVTVNIPVHCELLIFNRWGNEVQHFSGMLNTGANALWGGNSNGKNVTDGTYFYKMVFKLDETTTNCEIIDCSVEEQGFVTVRR